MSRSALWRWIRRTPWPQPRRWSPNGSSCTPQTHRRAPGGGGKVVIPSHRRRASTCSCGSMARPRAGAGSARNHAPAWGADRAVRRAKSRRQAVDLNLLRAASSETACSWPWRDDVTKVGNSGCILQQKLLGAEILVEGVCAASAKRTSFLEEALEAFARPLARTRSLWRRDQRRRTQLQRDRNFDRKVRSGPPSGAVRPEVKRPDPRSAGEPCTCREKFGARPIFKIFSLDQIRVDQEKKEVRKRRASIYRTSPSDAVEHFLVSHVTGWAILVYPALELDTGIFPFVLFLDTVLPRSSNLNLKKMPYRESELGARRSISCLVFVWQLECLNGNGPLRLFTGGTSRRSEKLRTLSHFHTVDPCKKAVFACLARRTCNKTIHALAPVLLSQN